MNRDPPEQSGIGYEEKEIEALYWRYSAESAGKYSSTKKRLRVTEAV